MAGFTFDRCFRGESRAAVGGLAIGLLAIASLGCSGGKSKGNPNGRPATGTVTYKGSPVEGATVSFISLTAPPAYGLTDAQGKFKLRAVDGDKVAIGDYKVTVVKTEAPPAGAETPIEQYVPPDENAPPAPAPKDLLPIKYKSDKDTPLSAAVTADGQNDFPLELAD